MNKAILNQAVALVKALDEEVKRNHHLVAGKPGFDPISYLPLPGSDRINIPSGYQAEMVAEHNGDTGVATYLKLRSAATSARGTMNMIAMALATDDAAFVPGDIVVSGEGKRLGRRGRHAAK